MGSAHITEIIDETPLASLDAATRERVEIHAAECAECSAALAASCLAQSMLRSHAEVVEIVPPPFFETRVLAAWRERQAERAPFWSFGRWWQASSGMVAAMVLVAVVLGGLTVFAPSNEVQADATNFGIFANDADVLSAEQVREMTREQMLEVIYTDRKEQPKR